jgi:hypothetical protein
MPTELMDYNSRDIGNSNSGKSQPPVLSPERPSPELDIIQNGLYLKSYKIRNIVV